MDATEIYPSSWLRAEDIGQKHVKVEIERVNAVDVKEGQRKLEIGFKELDKSLLLNKTNTGKLIAAYGKETDGWIGKLVELYTVMTTFQGSEVPAIRLQALLEGA